jgi:hypothetical protein
MLTLRLASLSGRAAAPLRAAVLPAALLAVLAPAAVAAEPPVPAAGTVLTGSIGFPRKQPMTLTINAHDPSRATAALGFDGRCTGGGIGEFWASYIPARETLRVRQGRFSAKLTGTARNVGGVHGRTAVFKWTLSGRFSNAVTASAKVSGTARLQASGHVISRCRIAGHPQVKLAP